MDMLAHLHRDELIDELTRADDSFEYGRGFRARDDVQYDDHLTDRQFIKV